jgi:tetratricopeptide (TPR) repeat protein
LLADNASSENQVRPLLPGEGPHRLIVTSRHTLGGLDARLVDVTVLDADSSVALLDAALRRARPSDSRITDDPDAAAKLAAICSGLPLALQIVAALLKSDPVQQVAELAEELAAEHDRLERLRYADGSGFREPSVAAAFEMSYRLLDSHAARMFRLLPLNPGPDISTASAAALADLPLSESRNLLGVLAKAHLLEATSALGTRWRLHDLLRLYARRMSRRHSEADAGEQARDRLFSHYERMAHAAALHLLAMPGVTVPGFFGSRDDAVAWFDAERTNLVPAVNMTAQLGKYQVAWDLSSTIVEYLSWRRYVSEWVAIASVGFRAAQHLGNIHTVAEALNNLGLGLRAARKFDEAASAHSTAVEVFQKSGDRRREGRALHNLALVLEDLRRFDEAITAYEQDLKICQEFGDWYGAETTLNSMSLCLMEVDRLDDALRACQDAFAISKDIGDRHGEAIALNNRSVVLATVHRLDDAVAAVRDALHLFQENGDRYNEAMALTNLGRAFFRAERLAEGIAASEAALAIFRELGDRHGEGRAVSNIAGHLLKMKRLEEAISADNDAVSIFQETGDRFNEGMSLNNLGLALHKAQRFDAAIIAYRGAVKIFRDMAELRPQVMALRNLADSFLEVNRTNEAEEASQAAAAILRQIGRGEAS